jgi:hypothetical protein
MRDVGPSFGPQDPAEQRARFRRLKDYVFDEESVRLGLQPVPQKRGENLFLFPDGVHLVIGVINMPPLGKAFYVYGTVIKGSPAAARLMSGSETPESIMEMFTSRFAEVADKKYPLEYAGALGPTGIGTAAWIAPLGEG